MLGSGPARVSSGGWITVSGHPPVPVAGILVGIHARITAGAQVPEWVRGNGYAREPQCALCSTRIREPGWERDTRLGFDGMCRGCLEHHARRCELVNQRLPGGGEVYCVGCGRIRPATAMCPREPTGQRRLRCWDCRRQQRRAAQARYRRRRRMRG